MTAALINLPGHSTADAQTLSAGQVLNFSDDHPRREAPRTSVVGEPSSLSGQWCDDSQCSTATEGTNLPADQSIAGAQEGVVGGDLTSTEGQHRGDAQKHTALSGTSSESSRGRNDAQTPSAALGSTTLAGQTSSEAQIPAAGRGAFLRDPLLSLMADMVDDLEGVRIATENRYRALTRDVTDSDGELRGLGLTDDVAEVKRIRTVLDGIAAMEHQAILNLQRQMRKHPLWAAWGKDAMGVGEKQCARLLAAIGDPYWNDLHDRPRTVSELWAYSGHHVVNGTAARRTKGVKSNWSDAARMRVHLIAESCIKLSGSYRDVYDDAREKYADATHSADCVRCGPKGKPAPAGSPLSLGHQHARALRAIAKTVLRDLWIASRDLHSL